jgi:ketosteroid isomerase-like protein
MTDRLVTERLLHRLYAARVQGDLPGLIATFSNDAIFRFAGATNPVPVSVSAAGVDKFRPLLSIMIKTFKLSDHVIESMLIDGEKAAVHWRADIFSRITGVTVPTEVMDMVEIRGGLVASYTEFFVAR